MAIVVSLARVLDELELLNDASTAYLNRKTGDVHTVQDDEADLVDDEDDPEDLADWQRDQLPLIREILESGDWLPLPTRFDIHEWEIMDRFVDSVKDDGLQDALRSAIRGKGAFRYFKDIIYRAGIEEDWYPFKRAALEEVAINWLNARNIPYTRDDQTGPRN